MRVNEIFHTVQGEGAAIGLPTTFVRTTGCNLRCSWCDTTYSFYDGEDVPVARVLEKVEELGTKRVCLTGGEPLLQRDAAEFVQALLRKGYEVLVETSGSLSVKVFDALAPRERLVLSLDVKCPGSAMQAENDWSNLPLLKAHDQLKFVIADARDYDFAQETLAKHPSRAHVIFQACWQDGTSNLKWLAERVLRDGLDVRVGTQLHKHIWGEARGH